MGHLDEGALRRLYDDPLALGEPERAHFGGCAECGRRFGQVAADARRAAAVLEVPAGVADTDAALAKVRVRGATAPVLRLRPRVPWRAAAAVAAAAVALVALAVTGTAQQLFTVMEPSQVKVVPVTTSELQAMPDLSQFGTVQWTGNPNLAQVADAAAAATAAGFAAPRAGAPPEGVPSNITYGVIGQSTGTFTFSAAKAQAWAGSHAVSLPAMPAGLDGSALELTVGPAIVAVYGGGFENAGSALPKLVVGKMKSPVLQSTGPSVSEIENYLLSIPGFPSDLAAQLRALGDPNTTLPLPVPVDRASFQQTDINGVQGVVVGDDTGLGSGAIWVKGGFVDGVAGTLTQDQVLAVARSLS